MDPETIEAMIAGGRDSYESRLAAAQARLSQQHWAEAKAHLEQAIQHDAQRTVAWQLLGQVEQGLGHLAAAREAWRQGIEVAQVNGDQQAEKVMSVWLRRLTRAEGDKG
jgi:Tfp pilus assembly protein PilF